MAIIFCGAPCLILQCRECSSSELHARWSMFLLHFIPMDVHCFVLRRCGYPPRAMVWRRLEASRQTYALWRRSWSRCRRFGLPAWRISAWLRPMIFGAGSWSWRISSGMQRTSSKSSRNRIRGTGFRVQKPVLLCWPDEVEDDDVEDDDVEEDDVEEDEDEDDNAEDEVEKDKVQDDDVEKEEDPFTRATIYGILQVKCRRPNSRPTLCASLRSRNARQHFTRATLYGNLQEKWRGPEPRTTLLCEPAQSKCTSTFHESNFMRKFTGRMPQTRA